jgi:Zn-dependent peptidase ImmA (M78 family)
MAAKLVPITGEVLTWAIEDAGLRLNDLADRLDLAPETIKSWISGTSHPNTTQTRALSKALGRPTSFFLLPRAPLTRKIPTSFRTLGSLQAGPEEMSREIEALRLAQRIQKTSSWVNSRLNHKFVRLPQASTNDNPAKFARLLADWLGWTLVDQLSGSEAEVTQKMRSKLQDLGVLVLHLSLSENLVRGFSIPSREAPIMAINTKDSYPARLFSYVHELAHLCLDDDSVCLSKENYGTERWCNQVAADLLLPAPEFRAYVFRRFGSEPVSEVTQVGSLKNYFHVSMQAIAIRLDNLHLSVDDLYERVVALSSKRRRGGPPNLERPQNKPRVRLQQYGRGFINNIFEAEDEGILPAFQVLDLLRVSRKELTQLREYAASGSEG